MLRIDTRLCHRDRLPGRRRRATTRRRLRCLPPACFSCSFLLLGVSSAAFVCSSSIFCRANCRIDKRQQSRAAVGFDVLRLEQHRVGPQHDRRHDGRIPARCSSCLPIDTFGSTVPSPFCSSGFDSRMFSGILVFHFGPVEAVDALPRERDLLDCSSAGLLLRRQLSRPIAP